jgi:oligopeptide transport system substrate-binding protein
LAAAPFAAGETRVEQGIREQVLHLGNLSEPRDLDPQITASVQDFNIVMALYEGLMNFDPKDLTPVPGVAERYEESDDGLVYTFHLRHDARWSNGDPVTAQDFVFSYKRMLTQSLGFDYAYMHFMVKGARDFYDGTLKDFSQTGYAALDDHTLRITLARPTHYFLNILAHCSWYPVHPKTIVAFGADKTTGTRWTQPGNLVGNGPFVLKQWLPHELIEVQKNPRYWDAANVRLNGIFFYPIEADDTEERAFRSGQLHATSTLPTSKIAVYRREHPDYIRLSPMFGTYMFRFNVTRKPLDDARVRRALALAIDREKIVRFVTRGGQTPAYNLTPPTPGGYVARAKLQGGADEARALLAAAGFPGGAGFPRLDFLYNTNRGHRDIAEAVQAMWRDELGIDINLHSEEAKVWEETMQRRDYDIARYAWIGDYADPNSFLEMMVTGNGNNQTGWSNPKYDNLIAEAARTLDAAKRLELFQEAEAILMDEAPIAPIYFYTRVNVRLPVVKGWYDNILDLHPYNRVFLER